MTSVIRISDHTESFAEDKDAAREIRVAHVEPALAKGGSVILDFTDVPLATQSFLHAMLSATIRNKGANVLDRLQFKGCTPAVKSLIKLVCEYSQETDALRSREAASNNALQRTAPRKTKRRR
jgi:hypothetical protein